MGYYSEFCLCAFIIECRFQRALVSQAFNGMGLEWNECSLFCLYFLSVVSVQKKLRAEMHSSSQVVDLYSHTRGILNIF